jgi:hypothetical protein
MPTGLRIQISATKCEAAREKCLGMFKVHLLALLRIVTTITTGRFSKIQVLSNGRERLELHVVYAIHLSSVR